MTRARQHPARAEAQDGPQRALAGLRGPQRWELVLRGMLGPNRTRTTTLNGVKVAYRSRALELPLGPNERLHWHEKAQIVAKWRGAAKDAAEAAGIPPQARIRVSAVLYRRSIGQADEDNDRARLKPVLDGLRDAGVVADDTRGHVEWGAVTEARGEPAVLLIVEAAS